VCSHQPTQYLTPYELRNLAPVFHFRWRVWQCDWTVRISEMCVGWLVRETFDGTVRIGVQYTAYYTGIFFSLGQVDDHQGADVCGGRDADPSGLSLKGERGHPREPEIEQRLPSA